MVTVSLYRLQTACKLEVAMYCVVVVGLAKGALQFVQDSVDKGDPPGMTDQVNCVPPVTFKGTISPAQMEVSFLIFVILEFLEENK
jgi:hypothetical protein